jgi:NAD(P)-dependent dehydrogenase (short-subunit alcohol dehydrogenase family)
LIKKVFITGANGGIGSSLVDEFKKNNYHVIGTDKGSCHNNSDVYFDIDLFEYVYNSKYKTQVNNTLHHATKDLDVLINNAAIQLLAPTKSISLDDWNASLAINLTSPLLLVQLFYDHLKRSHGCVINISSIHQQLTKKQFVSYATSKSALTGLTKALSVDVDGDFRVNGICPAAVETPMLMEGFKDNMESYTLLKDYHPSKTLGKPEEIARLAVFIADKRNTFLNGSIIKIDGGISSVLHDPA